MVPWQAKLIAGSLLVLAACGGPSGDDPGCSVPPAGDGFLAYVSVSPRAGGAQRYGLRLARADGGCSVGVGDGLHDDYAASWHAASGKVAYSSEREGRVKLVVRDLAAGGAETVLDTGDLQAANPSISPDGRTVVFEGKGPTGEPDLHVIPIGGGTPAPISPHLAIDAGPVWAPDGAAIYFVSDRSGAFELWAVHADGTGASQLTTGSAILGRPAVSPDGLSVAYVRRVAGKNQLHLRTLSTGVERALGEPGDVEPSFDATGTRLAVRTSRYGTFDVAVLDVATGAVLSRVTSGAVAAGLPAFPR